MNFIPGSLLRKLFPGSITSAAAPSPGPIWQVAEGTAGRWHYHVRDVSLEHALSQPAACGAQVMQTEVPLTDWGHVGHLNEKWCTVCARHAGIQTEGPPKSDP